MYLNKVRRKGNITPRKIRAIEGFLSWEKERKENPSYTGDMEDWCGIPESEVDKNFVDAFRSEFVHRYSDWDTDHEYGWDSLSDEVLYWRKANAIHNWFVKNVQNGVDDCGEYEVTKEQLETLMNLCKIVLKECSLEESKICIGTTWTPETGEVKNYKDGLVIKNTEVANSLLPTTCGFFFGSTDYDEYYINDLKHTIEGIEDILNSTDFDTEMITYSSSW